MDKKKIKILLIEDEDFDVRRVRNTVKIFEQSIEIVNVVSNGYDALKILEENSEEFDIIIMDYQIAGALRGEELIHKIKAIDQSLQIIVITKLTINITDFNFAKRLMEAGAFWYCTKYPGDIDEYIYQPTDFLMSIFNAFEKKKLEKASYVSNKKLIGNVENILEQKKIISISAPMEKLKSNLDKYAGSDINILISGPSGTGKELVAYNIHYRSKRRFENFVPINCGSIPHDLIESEFFGYEKGAFTGANASKQGLFEIADHGTIFLDEIGELPLNAQVKLLRVIQDGEIEKIGRTKSVKVDVRIIAATNKNLDKEIAEKRFREDLYYRLNVVPVNLLPLKERQDDIRHLMKHFLEVYSLDVGKPMPKISEEVLEIFDNYDWQGNVRELKNVAQRLIFNCDLEITLEDLENVLFIKKENVVNNNLLDFSKQNKILPLRMMEQNFRKSYFEFVRKNSESDADAAAKLGLAPPNFHRMCKELGLK